MELNFLGPIPGMKFVWIPPGEFWMGGPDAEPGWYEDESPRHRVRLTRGYYMMTTPVTQGQWEAVTGENPSKFNKVGPSAPVEKVSWYDVHVYIDKLNRTESYRFRLPTETEWEYACRAGTETAFYSGPITDPVGRDPNLDKVGWYRENSGGSTHPVGQKEPNAWGLYDMHGNVWEWCNDWYYGSYHDGPVTDPMGPGNGEFRVYRGGAWDSFLGDCRSAYRNGHKPDCTFGHLGFRLVAERRQDC